MRKTLFLFLAFFSLGVSAGQFVFQNMMLGVFWNPGLNGWGFAMDVQKGVLFSAIYGYNGAGEPIFLTLISSKSLSSNNLAFSGDVYETDQDGNRTRDVGDFDIDFVAVGGQPGWSLTMNSPHITLNNFILQRFGFLDADELSPISGGVWALTALNSEDVFDQAGGFFVSEDNRRTFSDGVAFVDILTVSADTEGFWWYEPDDRQYYLALSNSSLNIGLFISGFTNHNDMAGVAQPTDADFNSIGIPDAAAIISNASVDDFSAKNYQFYGITQERAQELYDRVRASGVIERAKEMQLVPSRY